MDIEINGVIGWDVLSTDVNKKLKEANGKDINVSIHSPGGSVFEGLAIFNAIKNYSGNVKIKVNGLAASMASIIALARGKFETAKSSIYMIHNARGIAFGDQNAIKKYADILEGISQMLAKVYAENTGKSLDYIRKKMDDETFYYGGEAIKNEGFAGAIFDDEEKADEAKAMAELEIEDCKSKMQNYKEPENLISEICAFFPDIEKKIITDTPKNSIITQGNNPATIGNKINGGKKMTLDELKASNPELYNQIFQAGVDKERSRVSAHMKVAGTYKASMEIVSKFVSEGKSVTDDDVFAEYLTAKAVADKVESGIADNPNANIDTSGKDANDDAEAFEKEFKNYREVKKNV